MTTTNKKESKKFNHFINGVHYGLSAYISRESENLIEYSLDWATPRGKAKGQYGGGNLKTTEKQILEINKAVQEIESQYGYKEGHDKKQLFLSKYVADNGIENIKYVVDYIHPFWQDTTMKREFTTKRLAENFIAKIEKIEGAKFIRLYEL